MGEYKTEFLWEEIADVHVSKRPHAIELTSKSPTPPRRSRFGTVTSGMTTVFLGGYSVEPNALCRVIVEMVERPEMRPILNSDLAAQYICAGPTWREIRKLEFGAEVPVSLAAPRPNG